MKVEITKEEYLEFLDLIHVASWVLVGHKTEPDPRIEKYNKVIQKFYALAGDMGYAGLVEYDATAGKYRPSKSLADTSPTWQFIDEFVDHAFWDELIIRFTERDAARKIGGYEELNRLSHADMHALEDPIEDRYSKEFNDNGIERLEVIEQFGGRQPVVTHD